jgi:hypothetical protein
MASPTRDVGTAHTRDMEKDPPPVSSVAEPIASVDDGRQPPSPLPRGWAGIAERDRRDRASSHPNAVGGFANILYPWRLYIAVGGGIVLLILLLAQLLRLWHHL